ncbi:MAG: PAS domain S-box-containing protein, partial [Cyclobacteriaceae bacterium]
MDSREKHNLRKRAEELQKLYDSDNSSSINEGDALKLLHELEVHQIELELSNDELILARDQAETLTSKYTALYDFAPMGYLTIDRVGTISDLNFSAAKMLGSDRSLLVGTDFKTFIDINELPRFSAFLIQVFYLKTKQISELKLKRSDPNARAYCRLEGIIDADGSCMIAIVDISLSKQNENDLKEAQRHAKESEKYLSSILNKVGDPLFVKDEQSRLLFVNDSFCKLFGVSKKNLIGKTLAENVSLEEKEHFLRIDKQVLATGRQSILEESLTLQDQETQIISTKRNRYVDDEGKKFLIGTVRNITGQKQAADKLRHSKQLLEASQAIARVGSWELELTTGNLFWTAETYRIHDTSPEEFHPTIDAHVNYFLPESRRIITEALRAATEEGKGYDLELETYTTKGRLISVRMTCDVSFTDGKPFKLMGIFQDISEYKQHQTELIQSKILLQSSIESPKDMVIISLDTKYNYLYFNTAHLNAMEQIYGTKPKVGNCIFDYITSVEDTKEVKSYYEKALKGESHVAISQYGEGDAIVYFETRYNPILDDHNGIIGITAFGQDITERQQFEKDLETSEEKFRNAITYAPYPLMIHADGYVLQLSDEWVSQTGYTLDDIPTIKKWSSLAYGKNAIPSNEFINELYNIEKPQSDGEWEVKIKDGSYVLWSFSSSPIGKLPNGKKMVISMASDITEIKKYRGHLEELVNERTIDLELRTTELKKANEGLLHAESEMHRAFDLEKELGELKSRFVS